MGQIYPAQFRIDRSKRKSRTGLVWAVILSASVIAAALLGGLQ